MDYITEQELLYGAKVYNKEKILESNNIDELIMQNLICHIDWSLLFNNGFELVFKMDNYELRYENKIVSLDNLELIIKQFLEKKKEIVPVKPEKFIESLKLVLTGLINGNLGIDLYLNNVSQIHYKLWTIKTIKNNNKATDVFNSPQYMAIKNIISNTTKIEIKEKVLDIFQNNKEADEIMRMEVLSNLPDNIIDYFLATVTAWDDFRSSHNLNVKEDYFAYMSKLLTLIAEQQVRISQIYFANELFRIINEFPQLLSEHSKLRQTIKIKVNEICGKINIDNNCVSLFNNLMSNLETTNMIIENIEQNATQ